MIKHPEIEMSPALWHLLAMYFVVLSHRARSRGQPKPKTKRLLGAIVTQFLVEHAEDIQKEYERIRLGLVERASRECLDPEQRAALAAPTAAPIPGLVRTGATGRRAKEIAQPVPEPRTTTRTAIRRLAGYAQQVRTRTVRTVATPDGWKSKLRKLDSGGAGST